MLWYHSLCPHSHRSWNYNSFEAGLHGMANIDGRTLHHRSHPVRNSRPGTFFPRKMQYRGKCIARRIQIFWEMLPQSPVLDVQLFLCRSNINAWTNRWTNRRSVNNFYHRSSVVCALHRYCKSVGAIPIRRPMLDDWFSTVPGSEIKTHACLLGCIIRPCCLLLALPFFC